MSKPDWSRLGRSSRNRGNTFERMVAKRLSEMYPGVIFNRTPTSGGHAIKGDIYIAPGQQTPWHNITIWCRTQKSISFESIMCDVYPLIYKWIEETGPNSMWVFRTKPGRVFVALASWRLRGIPDGSARLDNGTWTILQLDTLVNVDLNLDFDGSAPEV